MMWALSAVRFIRKNKNDAAGKALRSRLRQAARELGLPSEYQLTAKTIARQDGQGWGSPVRPTPRSVRIAATAKGFEYATSPGTATDTPAHYIWPAGTTPAQALRFANLDEAAAHIQSL